MVSQDKQAGLLDEVISDAGLQGAIKSWYEHRLRASDVGNGISASGMLRNVAKARDRVRELLPSFDQNKEHRFTFIDETIDPPVQYVILTRPGPPATDVEFTRQSKTRVAIERHEPTGR